MREKTKPKIAFSGKCSVRVLIGCFLALVMLLSIGACKSVPESQAPTYENEAVLPEVDPAEVSDTTEECRSEAVNNDTESESDPFSETDTPEESGISEESEETPTKEPPKAKTETSVVIPAVPVRPTYQIRVNVASCFVAVYMQSTAGNYNVLVKSFICSPGSPDTPTPLGSFKINQKPGQWHPLYGNTYGQWSIRFNNDVLFHSVPYRANNPATLVTEEYDKLGQAVSAGCVRMRVSDVKWLYDNCPYGTSVIVYSDANEPRPAGCTAAMRISQLDSPFSDWDPTDPNPENPWHAYAPDEPEMTVEESDSEPEETEDESSEENDMEENTEETETQENGEGTQEEG